MTRQTRRNFLKTTLTTAATVTVAGTKSSGKVIGANDAIRVAVAGINGRGSAHVGAFAKMDGVEIVYLADPDTRTFSKRQKQLKDAGRKEAVAVQDFRKVLDDKSVNAISIATPNHWHAPMTIMACAAGKDVYVEKPCSHNIREGRVAVQVARQNKCVVQHGTQNRASNSWAQLAAVAKSGKLGKLLVSRALCYKDSGTGATTRGNIGTRPTKVPPAELDFNIWLGPAQQQPYHENIVHYRWHWFWDFGNGDIGNQGVHQMDVARWLIPGATWPKTVVSFGGRYVGNGVKDQGETPNTQVTVMDYDETQLIFEVRGAKSKPYYGQGVGNILHFEAGTVAGGKLYPKGSEKAEAMPAIDAKADRKPSGDIFKNFISCVRSRKTADLDADIEVGHYSAGLCHLANISYRLGKDEPYSARSGKVSGNDYATDALARMEDHLKEGGTKLEGTSLHVGRKLDFDAASETFGSDAEANKLLTREYRAPFTIPDKV